MMCMSAGAKDVTNFVVHMSEDSLPPYSSITHEGIFYEHFFGVGSEEEALLSCDWSFASSKDPISGKMEYYVGCGLRGKLDGDGIRKHGRPPVNLVIVLDISGSMDSRFRPEETKSKLDVAKDCVMTLIDNLSPTDSFGLVTFDTRAFVIQELKLMSELNIADIKAQISQLDTKGGTDMEVGFHGGSGLFKGVDTTKASHMNRIIYLTDAQPNAGATQPGQLMGLAKTQADSKIFTSFVGLGVDFGVELVDAITQIKGCNYFTVMSGPEFKKLMEQDLEYIVTPCCFDVKVEVKSSSLVVERVYGSPGNEFSENGILMKMSSCFPSARDESGLTKGGIVLAKISSCETGNQSLELVLSYSDVEGKSFTSPTALQAAFGGDEERYSSNAIRKAIVLTRYVNAAKWWIIDTSEKGTTKPAVNAQEGIPLPPLSKQCSGPLQVSDHYKGIFRQLAAYMEQETDQLATAGDSDQHMSDHTQHLVELATLVSVSEIEHVLPSLCTNEEVEAGLTAGQLLQRCADKLGASNITRHEAAFRTEIKRRINEILVAKLKSMDKAELKRTLEKPAEEKRAALEDLIQFVISRSDQGDEDWYRIVATEANTIVHPVRTRPYMM